MSTTRAATGVHEQRAVAHAGEQGGVEELLGLRRERSEHDDGVGLPDEGGQLVSAVHAVAVHGARRPMTVTPNGSSRRLDRVADRAEPDDQHAAALELARDRRPTSGGACAAAKLAVGIAQERADHPLGHRRVARSACVAERRPGRDARLDPVRARGEHLKHPQPLEPRQRVGTCRGRASRAARRRPASRPSGSRSTSTPGRRELDGDLVRARGDGGDHGRRTLAGARSG